MVPIYIPSPGRAKVYLQKSTGERIEGTTAVSDVAVDDKGVRIRVFGDGAIQISFIVELPTVMLEELARLSSAYVRVPPTVATGLDRPLTGVMRPVAEPEPPNYAE